MGWQGGRAYFTDFGDGVSLVDIFNDNLAGVYISGCGVFGIKIC